MAAGFRGLLELVYRWLPGQQGVPPDVPGTVEMEDWPKGELDLADWLIGELALRDEPA